MLHSSCYFGFRCWHCWCWCWCCRYWWWYYWYWLCCWCWCWYCGCWCWYCWCECCINLCGKCPISPLICDNSTLKRHFHVHFMFPKSPQNYTKLLLLLLLLQSAFNCYNTILSKLSLLPAVLAAFQNYYQIIPQIQLWNYLQSFRLSQFWWSSNLPNLPTSTRALFSILIVLALGSQFWKFASDLENKGKVEESFWTIQMCTIQNSAILLKAQSQK